MAREQTVSLNEGIRVQEARFCLLCDSEGKILYQNLRDRFFSAPGIWALLQCPKCGLIWLNPRPVDEDIGKLYEDYCTHQITIPRFARLRGIIENSILAARLGYDSLASSSLQKILGKALSWIGPIREIAELSVMALESHPKGKLLDVACGNGVFLAKMRDLGWEVTGVEPDEQAVKVAREYYGLDVYKGTLEEVGFQDNTFDAIILSHVIEHVPNPISTLRE